MNDVDTIKERTSHCIVIEEGNYTFRNIESFTEKRKLFKLRYRVFCRELGWVLREDNGLETDDYDANAFFFGVFDKKQTLMACIRVIPSEASFMLERDFFFLIEGKHCLRKGRGVVELSRLCVAPESRKNRISGNFGEHFISAFLFKGLYRWCLRNEIRYLYAVTELKMFKLLRSKGFPCFVIGTPSIMPDGVIAVAFMLELEKLFQQNRGSALSPWFDSVQVYQS
jgi:N-acyl-L-homoserine lactone synthetase